MRYKVKEVFSILGRGTAVFLSVSDVPPVVGDLMTIEGTALKFRVEAVERSHLCTLFCSETEFEKEMAVLTNNLTKDQIPVGCYLLVDKKEEI